MTPDLSRVNWKKASRSNANGGDCVEVGIADDFGAVRDSKNRDGDALVWRRARWDEFLKGVVAGRFDG